MKVSVLQAIGKHALALAHTGGRGSQGNHDGAAGRAQWLRALSVLPENLALILSTHVVPGDMMTSSGSCSHQSHK